MLPSMPVLFPRESQSGDGFSFTHTPLANNFLEPPPKVNVPQSIELQSQSTAGDTQQIQKSEECKSESDEDIRESHFVTSYYNKVRSKLGVEKFTRFKNTLATFVPETESPVELYRRLEAILGQDELMEEFLVFLTPGQATEIGKFMDHLMLTRINKFIHCLQTTLSRKPAKLRKVVRAVTAAAAASAKGTREMRTRVEPLLKTNQRLLQYFRALFPDDRPPDSLYTAELAEQFPESSWATDTGEHRMELEDAPAADKRTVNDITYLHERVFLRRGKVLCPAGVKFPRSNRPQKFHMERLAPAPDPTLPTTLTSAESKEDCRKNLKSPKKISKSKETKVKEKKEKKSPERSGKSSAECKKSVRVALDAKIQKMAAKNLLDLNTCPTSKMDANSHAEIVQGSVKDESKARRKREISPDKKENGETKKTNKNKHTKRLEIKKTEEENKPENARNTAKRTKTVFDKGKSRSKTNLQKLKDDRDKTYEAEIKIQEQQHRDTIMATEETSYDNLSQKNNFIKQSTEEDFTKTNQKTVCINESLCDVERKISISENVRNKCLKSEVAEEILTDHITEPISKTVNVQTCEWTREEDKTILLVLKKGSESEETFKTMKELLPHRSLTELRERFFHVMDLLRQMALGEVT